MPLGPLISGLAAPGPATAMTWPPCLLLCKDPEAMRGRTPAGSSARDPDDGPGAELFSLSGFSFPTQGAGGESGQQLCVGRLWLCRCLCSHSQPVETGCGGSLAVPEPLAVCPAAGHSGDGRQAQDNTESISGASCPELWAPGHKLAPRHVCAYTGPSSPRPGCDSPHHVCEYILPCTAGTELDCCPFPAVPGHCCLAWKGI